MFFKNVSLKVSNDGDFIFALITIENFYTEYKTRWEFKMQMSSSRVDSLTCVYGERTLVKSKLGAKIFLDLDIN